jgi:AraC family transcriptional regulator
VEQTYTSRINKVLDYIETHLSEEIDLNELADVACFSRYHFHRIFKTATGETLQRFIQRLRLERAYSQLWLDPDKSITEIAFDMQFASSAAFARAFRENFGMSASMLRKKLQAGDSNLGKMDSNSDQLHRNWRQAYTITKNYNFNSIEKLNWRVEMKENSKMKADVKVVDLPEKTVAYLRHIGPYAGDSELFGNLFNKLLTWAGPRNLLTESSKFMSIYHDNPEVTDPQKLRTSICLSVDADTEVSGEVGKMVVSGGKYAIARFELDASEYGEAWNLVYGGWLPNSGYQPTDDPPLEVYHNNPDEHPEGKHIFDIMLPVKPL